ncbi:uncharacterized protein LOC144580172 isoform X2 [Callithrix jacchus]
MKYWREHVQKTVLLFEVLAVLDSAVTPGLYYSKTFLLRDGKNTLPCVFYEITTMAESTSCTRESVEIASQMATPTGGNTCLPCPDKCELCHSVHVCTRCTRVYFIAPTNHTCQKLECGRGEVQDPDYEECVPCEEGCLGCSLVMSSSFAT